MRSRRTRRVCAANHRRSAQDRGDPVEANRAESQHRGLVFGKRDDRRLDAVLAWAAVENQCHLVAEIFSNMLRCRGAYAAEAIGRRRGDAVAPKCSESSKQASRDRMA